MSIFKLFSQREREARGELPDVYQYDKLPPELRVQIIHIIRDTLGDTSRGYDDSRQAYAAIRDILVREFGWFQLTEENDPAPLQLINFILKTPDKEKLLDAIDVTFKFITIATADQSWKFRTGSKMLAPDALEELNARFRQHAVGYQFEAGSLRRVDSEMLHAEVVRPALQLLSSREFRGANKEFLSAHEHYRHDRFEEAITDCLKALESTLKTICDARKWTFDQRDTAKKLLGIVFERGLLPTFLESEFAGLRSAMESGPSTLRNRQGGHGQGTELRNVPRHVASFQLHMTAANILLLVEAHQATK